MTTEELNKLKSTAKSLSDSLKVVLGMAHSAIKEVEKDNPQQAHELLKDLEAAQNSKDMIEVNNLMNKYANFNK
ncbi:hypothetical protein [uncultured phage]|nr:hypothetical protein [uncultured phage]